MVDGVVMCEKDYAELVATWPCLGCGKEIPTGDPALAFITFSRSLPYFLLTTSFPDILNTYAVASLLIWIKIWCIGILNIEYYGVSK